ncbi:MAG: DUF4355 domain-containing protein [Ruminiclostridium sp.]|nr:DUF4355 domain-containing protein [Ruminiclostridium sp.]
MHEEEKTCAEQPEEKLYTQAELDAALNTERENYETKLAEAEKLSAMNDDAKAEYLRGQLEKALAEREEAVAKRELMADALDKLEAAGLPKQLSECLNYSGREACEKSIERVGKAFESALTEAVTQRLRGRMPRTAVGGSSDAFLDGLGIYNGKY